MGRYVHGYSERETQRLSEQSSILEELLHSGTAYAAGEQVLEAGCGVGAQTEILARKSPETKFTSIDFSAESLEKAKGRIANAGHANVVFQEANIEALPLEDEFFDHVFVCFVLEHLEKPLSALRELKRVLKAGGTITAIEGDHGSCFWYPETEESIKVWECLITAQQQLGHDPLVGRNLYPLLHAAEFRVRYVEPRLVYGDGCNPELLDGMVHKIICPMVETAKQQSLEMGLVDEETWAKGMADLDRTGYPPGGTFFYTWFKGVAAK